LSIEYFDQNFKQLDLRKKKEMTKGRGRGKNNKPAEAKPSNNNPRDEDFPSLGGAPPQKLPTQPRQPSANIPSSSGASSAATSQFPSLGGPATKMPTWGSQHAAKAVPKEFEDAEKIAKTLLPVKENLPAAPLPQTIESKMSKMNITTPKEPTPEMGNCYLKKNQLPTTLPITSILSSWHYKLK